jgi:hypothetical protein
MRGLAAEALAAEALMAIAQAESEASLVAKEAVLVCTTLHTAAPPTKSARISTRL